MGRGKFKGKPTGKRQFSTPEEMLAGSSSRPRTFKREEAAYEEEKAEEESSEESGEESGDEESDQRRKGTEGLISIENPNLVKPKNLKAKDLDCFVCRWGKQLSFLGVKGRSWRNRGHTSDT
ncbi:unnamed protein product [Linum tenue]|uniref:Uncharacterized protein n=1 Tax=Linum tenue TaxID=586396 RepID=A0AAV0MH66_9ROSI|nr:unnamed protein product [Linum tenue]